MSNSDTSTEVEKVEEVNKSEGRKRQLVTGLKLMNKRINLSVQVVTQSFSLMPFELAA